MRRKKKNEMNETSKVTFEIEKELETLTCDKKIDLFFF